jgi:hypothetical protein
MSKREDQPKAARFLRVGVAGRNRPAEVGGGEQAISFGDREEPSSHKNEGKKNWRMSVELSVKKRKALNRKNEFIDLCETVGKESRLLKCTCHNGGHRMAAIGAIEMRTSRHSLEKSREADPIVAENSLLRRYGPLMNLAPLASILDRSPDGLRVTLRSSGEWVEKINSARLQLGRRVYFRTADIAEVLGIR